MAPTTDFDDVLARLGQLDTDLPATDGVRWFNRVYLRMTEAVVVAARAGRFEDVAFVERLDCLFADLYFDALAAGASAPRAWCALFEARQQEGIAPVQFAVAGVSAHINRDLAVALVRSYEACGGSPKRRDARHRDYLVIDEILERAQADVTPWLFDGWLGTVDRVLGRHDDVLRAWSIGRARRAAWVAAEVQWALRDLPRLAGEHLEALDRTVGFAGRAMLLPRPRVRSAGSRSRGAGKRAITAARRDRRGVNGPG